MSQNTNPVDNFLDEVAPIYVSGEITTESAVRFQVEIAAKLKFFEDNCAPLEERTITVNITDCAGGSVSAGWAMYDVMENSGVKIEVICSGMVASMGVIIALAGTKGLRKAYPHTEFLLHQPLGGTQGQASDILIQAAHIKEARMRIYEVVAEKTGQSAAKISADCDRDFILSAKEAIDYGLIDKIIKREDTFNAELL